MGFIERLANAAELYGFEIEEDFRGNLKNKGLLGLTDFKRGKVKVPPLRDFLSRYILGHEIRNEIFEQPQTEAEHTNKEYVYLKELEKSGSLGEYVAGLLAHKYRIKYGDKTGFSTPLKNYVIGKLEKYSGLAKELDPEVRRGLGLRPAYNLG